MSTLQELLSSTGLAHLSVQITNAALPSIRLKRHTMDERQFERGATKFGGLPDFPLSFSWPTYNGLPTSFHIVLKGTNDELVLQVQRLIESFDKQSLEAYKMLLSDMQEPKGE